MDVLRNVLDVWRYRNSLRGQLHLFKLPDLVLNRRFLLQYFLESWNLWVNVVISQELRPIRCLIWGLVVKSRVCVHILNILMLPSSYLLRLVFGHRIKNFDLLVDIHIWFSMGLPTILNFLPDNQICLRSRNDSNRLIKKPLDLRRVSRKLPWLLAWDSSRWVFSRALNSTWIPPVA